MDDPAKAKKRAEYLGNGTTTLQHITGNIAADAAAETGAGAHNIPPLVIAEAEDRAHITALMQHHLVASWAHWIAHTNGVATDRDYQAAIAQLEQDTNAPTEDYLDELHNAARALGLTLLLFLPAL